MNIRFWVVMGTEKQLNFEGHMTNREVPVGNQHIVYQEVLMCGQSRNALKGSKRKQSTRQARFLNVPLCPDCEKAYKEHPDLGWMAWQRAAA